MNHPLTTRRRLIATALLVSCLPVHAQNTKQEPKNNSILVKDYLGKWRTINDSDGDGWDDLWCHFHPELKHRNKSIDTDGDALTDYEEMIMWRDPFVKGPIPKEPTPAEIKAAEQAEEKNKAFALEAAIKAWPAREAELAKTLRKTFPAGKETPDPNDVSNDNAEVRARLFARKDKATAEKNRTELALDAIARKNNIERTSEKGTLAGEDANGGPILMSPQDATSANTIFADDLWPAGLYPFQNPSFSRNLTGAGIRASVFEAAEQTNIAGILTTHAEFNGGRAVQVDGGAPSNHGTAVANVIIGGGILDVFRNSTNLGKELRGVAYQGELHGYNLTDFTFETSNTALSGQSFSNHSYGVTGGWETIANSSGQLFLLWRYPQFTEDPRLGAYSSTMSNGVSSADLDQFVNVAETHLPIYASGNPTGGGPGNPTPPNNNYQYLIPNGSGGFVFSTDLRDWVNGDDGYDTVLSPATAKNVLTVGSILDFSASAYTISSFSGAGPTDDGRIKPDLVAVGQRNSALGFGNSLFAANKANTTAHYNGINADSLGQTNLAGTSFAAPSVCGGLMLAEQRRKQLFPAAARLLASTWRAASIHTASDVEAQGPDYLKGWGVFNAERLVSILEADASLGRGSLIKEFSISTGSPKTFYVKLAANSMGETTLAWNDLAGNPAQLGSALDGQTPMLVNNLDMVIQDVATSTNYLPWVLNPDLNGESAAIRGAVASRGTDSRNNVEKITINATAQERRLKITISPNGVLQGGNQKISLILSGITLEPPVITSSGFNQNPANMDEYSITFISDPGTFYTLESSTTLEGGSWSSLVTVKSENSSTTVLTNRNPNESKRFWRMRRGQ